MLRISPILPLLVVAIFFTCSAAFASGKNNHSHDHHSDKTKGGTSSITYKESKDGIDAYLEFSNLSVENKDKSSKFVAKCDVRAFLKNAKSGESVETRKMALRRTNNHGDFGEAKALLPVDQGGLGGVIILKERGLHHFLLIADISDAGTKEFHFHHAFD